MKLWFEDKSKGMDLTEMTANGEFCQNFRFCTEYRYLFSENLSVYSSLVKNFPTKISDKTTESTQLEEHNKLGVKRINFHKGEGGSEDIAKWMLIDQLTKVGVGYGLLDEGRYIFINGILISFLK